MVSLAAQRATLGSALELADIFRAEGARYRASHRLSMHQRRAMHAIEVCRTPELGGHVAACDHCGATTLHYHSCRNRCCPKCQTLTKQRWVEARQAELLDIEQYFHVVFTLPHALNALAQANPRLLYNLLFQCAAATLQGFARNPKWLGGAGELGITMVLHTWSQNLGQHNHVHCVVSGGSLSLDGQRWLRAPPGFLFPVRALSTVFRAKYLDALKRAAKHGELHFGSATAELASPQRFAAFLETLRSHDWVIYAKRPFAGPQQVIAYLGRYTHRIALSNHRLVDFSQGKVRFRWRDYRHADRIKTMSLPVEEFIRRFLLHVLPSGFVRIRHFGLLANRCRGEKLARSRELLHQPPPPEPVAESAAELMLRLTGRDIERCPHCTLGKLFVVAVLLPRTRGPPQATGPP